MKISNLNISKEIEEIINGLLISDYMLLNYILNEISEIKDINKNTIKLSVDFPFFIFEADTISTNKKITKAVLIKV